MHQQHRGQLVEGVVRHQVQPEEVALHYQEHLEQRVV